MYVTYLLEAYHEKHLNPSKISQISVCDRICVTIIMKEFIILEFQSDIKASSRAIDFYAVRLIFKKKINNRGRERWERFVKFRK